MTVAWKTVVLTDAITVYFYDVSNRYFGDFHKVRLNVEVVFLNVIYQGQPLRFKRALEQMAVTTAGLDKVKDRLANDFLKLAGTYMTSTDFAERLVEKQKNLPRKPF